MLNVSVVGCAVLASMATAYAIQRAILTVIVRAMRPAEQVDLRTSSVSRKIVASEQIRDIWR